MQLLTKTIQKHLPPLYAHEKEKDPLVICKFFDPVGSWTWYVLEGSPVDTNGEPCAEHDAVDFLFFGFVVGFEAELGYFSLRELETAKDGVWGLRAVPIERDLYFTPCRLSGVKNCIARKVFEIGREDNAYDLSQR